MTKEQKARRRARAAGLTRYFGKLCTKHPELNGERIIANNGCLKCTRLSHAKLYERRRQERDANGGVIFGKVCAKHPELNGARRANNKCVSCHCEYEQQRRQRPAIKARNRAHNRACRLAQRNRGCVEMSNQTIHTIIPALPVNKAPSPRTEAKRTGAKHYFGKICPKHPELKGVRYTVNSICTKCLKTTARKRFNANIKHQLQLFKEAKARTTGGSKMV
jgi:hypothetical protein